MVTSEVEDAMEAASDAHFSGLRLDETSLQVSNVKDLNRQPCFIGVAGGTASGKTTICDMIIRQLHDNRVIVVHQDSFYRDLTPEESEHVEEYNFDHPDAYDTEHLLDCINKLKQNESTHLPIYDFKNHCRCTDAFYMVFSPL